MLKKRYFDLIRSVSRRGISPKQDGSVTKLLTIGPAILQKADVHFSHYKTS